MRGGSYMSLGPWGSVKGGYTCEKELSYPRGRSLGGPWGPQGVLGPSQG